MKKKNRNKKKFANPHYSPKRRIPASRGHSHGIVAKFISTDKGGVAFRVLDESKLPELLDNAVIPGDSESFDSISLVNPFAGVELDEGVKYYIDNRHTASAVSGDIVRLQVLHRYDAEVTDVLYRGVTDVCGIVYQAEDELGETVWVLEPDSKRLGFSIIITEIAPDVTPVDGYKAVARITEYPERGYSDAEGLLVRVYGDAYEKAANYRAILESNAVRVEFSDDVLAEAEQQAAQALTVEGRVDLRDRVIFTLDGADAKDLDDAITVSKAGENYVLGVHIADVSHYVTRKSRLDREAMERGTSIYFADKVVPMLPTALSNGICSLNGGVDRYALSAEMTVDSRGEILSVNIFKSVIRSAVRGVYSEFNQLISGEASEEIRTKYAVIPEEMIGNILSLYEILRKKGIARGALELDSEEAAIILDEKGEPIDITLRARGVGERIIEQFMLCANEGVASWLSERGLPCVYRVHDQPDEEKLSDFLLFAHNLGLRPEYRKRGTRISPLYFSHILERARERGIGTPVSYMLLRTMMKARYSEVCSGHFGLGTEKYCHFTSPIRRYPDLSVHRIISAALKNGDTRVICDQFSGFAALSARKSSDCEIKALTVEREMDDLFKALYLSKRVGEEFDAVISSVTAFGMFCRLPNTCEGLVGLSSLDGYYRFNETTLSLVSDKHTYRIGEAVRIRVENVDIPTSKIDFVLV